MFKELRERDVLAGESGGRTVTIMWDRNAVVQGMILASQCVTAFIDPDS